MLNATTIFKSLIVIPLFGLILTGLMLPSDGNHGIMSPKSLAFIGTLLSTVFYAFWVNRLTRYQLSLIAFTSTAFAFLFGYLMIGVATTPDDTIAMPVDQFKQFLITLVVVLATLYIVSEHIVSAKKVLRWMIGCNMAFSTVKVLVVVLHFLSIVDITRILDIIGIRFMSMQISEGLSRLQTSVDIVTPFFLYFVLQNKRLGLGYSRLFVVIYSLVSVLSIGLSFSRFLLGVAVLSACIHWFTLTISRFIRSLIAVCLLIVFAVTYVGIEETEKAIILRFDSQSSFASDKERVDQVEALVGEYEKNQLIGKGLGGYVFYHLRDSELKHSYEVQWVAFLMQFGGLGLFLLLIPMGIVSVQLLRRPVSRSAIGFFLLFGVWLLSGFTNPYLVSLTSGIVYTSFLLAAHLLRKEVDDTAFLMRRKTA